MTRSAIDRLGKRLSLSAEPRTEDLRALATFQREHAAALETAAERLQTALETVSSVKRAQLTQRVKTVNTLIDKVRRGTALSRVQDIVGVRIVANLTLTDQDRVVDAINATFPKSTVTDRRQTPMQGYRAVHVVVRVDGCLVEVQVRTLNQHAWADAFEKLADRWGRQIRYGGAPAGVDAAEVAARTMRLENILEASSRITAYERAQDAVVQVVLAHYRKVGADTPESRDAAIDTLSHEDRDAIRRWAAALVDLDAALRAAGPDIRRAFADALKEANSAMQQLRVQR